MANQTSPLFNLPGELREYIYKNVLAQPSSTLSLLRTCHRIYTESYGFLFQRTLQFGSQSLLYRWLEEAPQKFLPDVTKISLELQDVDLTPLLLQDVTLPILQPTTSPTLHTWDIYERETEKLKLAFRKLPNLKSLTLRIMPGQLSHLYRDFLNDFIRMLAFTSPNLIDLRFNGNVPRQTLKLLPSFKTLNSISLDNFPASSATEVATAISPLNLKHISLISHLTVPTFPQYHEHSTFASNQQPLAFQHLGFPKYFNLQPATKFRADGTSTSTSTSTSALLPFTAAFLDTFTASPALSSLYLTFLHSPPPLQTIHSIEMFLKRSGSSIKRLELDWPRVDPEVLERCVSQCGSLECLWVRADDRAGAFEIFTAIDQGKHGGGMECLREVVVLRDAWPAAKGVNAEESYGALVRSLGRGGGRGERDVSSNFQYSCYSLSMVV